MISAEAPVLLAKAAEIFVWFASFQFHFIFGIVDRRIDSTFLA